MKKIMLLLLFGVMVLTSTAQEKVYQIEEITVINYGDGRLLFRLSNEEKTPLNGSHRLIDGSHSEYILADFKDGMYHVITDISKRTNYLKSAVTKRETGMDYTSAIMVTDRPCKVSERL